MQKGFVAGPAGEHAPQVTKEIILIGQAVLEKSTNIYEIYDRWKNKIFLKKKNSLRWPNWQSFLTGSTEEYASQDTKRIIPIGLATSEKSVNIHKKENMHVELRYISSSFSEVGIKEYDIISFYTAHQKQRLIDHHNPTHTFLVFYFWLISVVYTLS